ncbi:MAG: hypothetical protein M1821_009115 [Bathelium mastoideum]|nr:MAG: hypothetical protein M1821_009115 [Bathelium mastoideum]
MAPVSMIAKNKKRSVEVAITSEKNKSSKRPRADISESVITNDTSPNPQSLAEITPVKRHQYQPDWRELLCQLIGANSASNNEAILEATNKYLTLLSPEDSVSDEETRSPSPVNHPAVYSVLHRRHCARWQSTCIDTDIPLIAEEGHLVSRDRHQNLDRHIAQKPGLGFIVFHEYRCCVPGSRQVNAEEDLIPYEQNMWPTSPLLVDALRVALKDVSIVPIARIVGNEYIRNPHVWIYHLRHLLTQRIAEQTEERHRSHLELFVKVLQDDKKNEFEEVDQLISTGKITHKYLEYLFIPGSIIVENKDSRGVTFQRLCKIQHWPEVDYQWTLFSAGKPELEQNHRSVNVIFQTKTVRWDFDGNFYKVEDDTTLLFQCKEDEPLEIQKLPYFPKKYLSKLDRKLVKLRGTLLASNIVEVEWNQAAFDTVVLGEDLKNLIKALVTNVIEPTNATDIIEGKGNGLVILLHGGPGTGKTLTAESVAEYARKPLYRVTCGDIGTSPGAIEEHLKNALALGKMWDCVVLLDEAEVFLQERSLIDINRNALVSVFLRVLEYYDGIIILTSNRVGTFDEGFKSRIQFAIHYKTLELSSRKQIWTNFLQRLVTSQSDELDIDDLERHVGDLARYVLNGRQIRNVLTTGRQLARYEKKPLTFERLKRVIDLSSRFDKYLKDVNDGLDDNELARGDSIR